MTFADSNIKDPKLFILSTSMEQKAITKEILDFFRDNPDAKVTIEDIVRWLLPLARIELSVDTAAEAIEQLLAKGLLKKGRRGDGTVFFGIQRG